MRVRANSETSLSVPKLGGRGKTIQKQVFTWYLYPAGLWVWFPAVKAQGQQQNDPN